MPRQIFFLLLESVSMIRKSVSLIREIFILWSESFCLPEKSFMTQIESQPAAEKSFPPGLEAASGQAGTPRFPPPHMGARNMMGQPLRGSVPGFSRKRAHGLGGDRGGTLPVRQWLGVARLVAGGAGRPALPPPAPPFGRPRPAGWLPGPGLWPPPPGRGPKNRRARPAPKYRSRVNQGPVGRGQTIQPPPEWLIGRDSGWLQLAGAGGVCRRRQTRKASVAPQAWASQPRAVCGASPSRISGS